MLVIRLCSRARSLSLFLCTSFSVGHCVCGCVCVCVRACVCGGGVPWDVQIDVWEINADLELQMDQMGEKNENGPDDGVTQDLSGVNNYSRILFLDGVLQSSTADEQIYHETLVHPGMTAHPRSPSITHYKSKYDVATSGFEMCFAVHTPKTRALS